jgi:stage V sporulation protein G
LHRLAYYKKRNQEDFIMNIKTEIKRTFEDNGKLITVANLVIDEGFIIKDVRLVNGAKGLFVSMPSHKMNDGSYVEICHPIRSNVREQIEKSVLEAYYTAVTSEGENKERYE